MKLVVVTSNPNKAHEVAAFFSGAVSVTHVALECPELRSDDVSEIAREKARFAYGELGSPLIVDDTAFEIDALNGFPGPYASFVLDSIGTAGILKLMDGVQDRSASFTTAIGYADANGIQVFGGMIHGTITAAPRGRGGFGYDPIFEYNGKTLAELPLAEKNRVSHRAKALGAFHDWFMQKHSSLS